MADEEDITPLSADGLPLHSGSHHRKQSRRHRCLVFVVFSLLLVVFYLFGFIVLLHLEKDIIFVECFTSDHATDGMDTASLRRVIDSVSGKNVTNDEFVAVYDRFAVHFGSTESHRRQMRRPVTDICRDWLTFSVLTLTTVGYGGETIRSEGGKIFYSIYCCLGIPMTLLYLFTLARFIRRMTEHVVALCHCRLSRKGTVYYMEIQVFLVLFILFGGYFALGVVDAVYSEPSSSIVDALYFYFVTFSTIGYADDLVPRAHHRFYPVVVVGGLVLMMSLVDATWKLTRKIKDQYCLCHFMRCCCCCRCCKSTGDDDPSDKDSNVSLVEQSAGVGNGLHLRRFRYDSDTPYVTS